MVEPLRKEQVYRIYCHDGNGGLRLSMALDRDPGNLVSIKTIVLDKVGAKSTPKAEGLSCRFSERFRSKD